LGRVPLATRPRTPFGLRTPWFYICKQRGIFDSVINPLCRSGPVPLAPCPPPFVSFESLKKAMSPAVVQHRHSGRAPFNTVSSRAAPYCKRSSPARTTATTAGTPPSLVSSSSSRIPPLLPLSWTKLQTIISWRNEVSAATSSSPSCSHSNVTPIEMEQEVLDYWDEGDDGIDRYTFVPEGGGERRLFDLPHPEMNPLVSSSRHMRMQTD
jgi:hypothetical protein